MGGMTSKFTDKTEMPFGKHKGVALGEVPASYLLWLGDQPDMRSKHPELYAYVDSGRQWLEKEKSNER